MRVQLRLSWAAIFAIPALVVLAAWVFVGPDAAFVAVAFIAGLITIAAFSLAAAIIIWHWLNN